MAPPFRRRYRRRMANPVYAALGTTIFEDMSAAARANGAINLGQGFPDDDGPLDIREVAARALIERSNQYPPMPGLPELRAAVADHYRRFQQVDVPADHVLVTSGATEAIAAALLAVIAPGDEVLLIEPAYDAYLPLVLRAGGTPRFVTLRPPEWRLTREALDAAVTPRTRAIVFNDPLNPAARAFGRGEVELLGRFCVDHDLVAVCDEVWEHVLFDDVEHVPLITMPGMAERTIKIGSAGKIFSMTGWKVGFVLAGAELFRLVSRAHQFLTFTTPPNLQAAVAYGLGKPKESFDVMRAEYQRSRDRLAAALQGEGFAVLPSQGTYFVCVDLPASGVEMEDAAFCRYAVATAGVAAIPLSPFYAEAPTTTVIRLCFAKADDVLDAAVARLVNARRGAALSPR
jgi:N-succinyldiaminopimelate aminotransferase